MHERIQNKWVILWSTRTTSCFLKY
uniref:Uncharacterized protein n=1 Tax=Anguilla anguilla TaxID=7936 RepID=A0A0E9SG91_ANGAN